MQPSAILNLYTHHHRRAADLPGYQRQDVPPVVRYIDDHNGVHSFIGYTDLSPATLTDTIERETLYFRNIGHNFEWKVFAYDQPASLKDSLQAHNFEIGEEEALLVLDLQHQPTRLQQDISSHDIREITDPKAINTILQAVQQVVFGPTSWHSDAIGEQKRTAPQTLRFYAAYVDDRPISAAWMQLEPGDSPFVGLYGGATLPAYRGRGLYTALIQKRAQIAQAEGLRFLHVEASPMSRPILEKNGFIYLTSTWAATYTVTPAT
jgi:GNAT superfamily N-acetyltransferase